MNCRREREGKGGHGLGRPVTCIVAGLSMGIPLWWCQLVGWHYLDATYCSSRGVAMLIYR